MKKKWIIWVLLLFYTGYGYAQVKCFARAQLDRNAVYVQQPFRITITVLTATWYTAPLDFDNIQIPNAFILPFDQTVPGMFPVDNKQYAGLQFYFIVFPYNAGSFTVPEINIVATTPPEGSAVSQKVTIHTSPIHFIVKAIPENTSKQEWMVAKNVSVSEKWNKPLNSLKVGDVVERTITIDARGTLPQFIPVLPEESLDFASTYPQPATLRDERDDYDANGRMEQSIIYLFEKEGDFEIPAIPVTWWNPNTSRLYNRNAAARKIHIAANPALGIVATLKDSLQARQVATAKTVAKKETRKIFGLPWYWAALIIAAALILLYGLTRLCIGVIHNWQARHALYLKGEQYAFKQLMRSKGTYQQDLAPLYRWWDRWPFPGKSAAIGWQMRKQDEKQIQDELSAGLGALYRDDGARKQPPGDFKKLIRAYRRKWVGKQVQEDQKISGSQRPYY